MPNVSDKLHQALVDAAAAEEARMENYKTLYTENDAYRLANAYAQYPWINPEILVTTVLSGNDDVLPRLSDYALAQMAKARISPYDISRQDEIHSMVREGYAAGMANEDPEGNVALQQYQESVRRRIR